MTSYLHLTWKKSKCLHLGYGCWISLDDRTQAALKVGTLWQTCCSLLWNWPPQTALEELVFLPLQLRKTSKNLKYLVFLSPPLFFTPLFLSLNLLADREQRGRSGMKSESKAKEKASALIPALSWMPVSRTYSINILNIGFHFGYK